MGRAGLFAEARPWSVGVEGLVAGLGAVGRSRVRYSGRRAGHGADAVGTGSSTLRRRRWVFVEVDRRMDAGERPLTCGCGLATCDTKKSRFAAVLLAARVALMGAVKTDTGGPTTATTRTAMQ